MQVANGIAEEMVAIVIMLQRTHVVVVHCYLTSLKQDNMMERERVQGVRVARRRVYEYQGWQEFL